MKKVYLSMLALTLGITSTKAQETIQLQGAEEMKSQFNSTQLHSTSTVLNAKALGVQLWSNDFSNPNDWLSPADANGFLWEIGDVPVIAGPDNDLTDYMGAMASTTNDSYGYYTGVDELLSPPYDAQNAVLEYNGSVDLTGINGVALTFEQRYRAFNEDTTYVDISNDGGTTWTAYPLNTSIAANSGVQNSITINISSVAANQSDVRLRFRWQSTAGTVASNIGSGYGWMVDDVSISSLADNDIVVENSSAGVGNLFYHQVPVSQIAPITFLANILNDGGDAQTGVQFELSVNGVVEETSAPVTLNPQDRDTIGVTFTPPTTPGVYTFGRAIVADAVDDIPSNNQFNVIDDLEVGGDVYARDNGTFDGENVFDNSFNSGYEVANLFDVITDGTVDAIDMGISSNPANVGKEIYGIIYSNSAGLPVVASTDFRLIETADLNSVISIPITGGVDLTSGSYLVALGCTEEFYYATAGNTLPQTSFLFYPTLAAPAAGGNLFTTQTPVVRLRFQSTVGVEENTEVSSGLGQNAPNPFSANSTITFELQEAAEVSFEIRDLSGKLVKTYNLGNLNAGIQSLEISAANLATGAYTYTMIAGNKIATKNMIIQK